MGLDMYLNARRYLSKHFNEGDEQIAESISKHFPELGGRKGRWGDPSPVKEVHIEVGYWRKANAVHDWFVREVQGGEDNCAPYYVEREQLQELRDLCQKVLDDREQARELLPPAAGFFFGSTDIDEGYFSDLELTIQNIDNALSLPNNWQIEYQSSW